MFKTILFVIVFSILFFRLSAQSSDSIGEEKASGLGLKRGKLTLNGYFDFMYAFGFHDPNRAQQADFGRRYYTSSPFYADKFTLPYGYLSSTYEIDRLTFRLALHVGDIVESLYAQEQESLRMLREASINYKFNSKFSIEAGIYPSLYGFEIFISKDNLHATRCYIADFAPDYEAGFRLKYQVNQKWSARLMVLNGWQEIKDSNGKKALGLLAQYDYKNVFFNWGTYLGDVREIGENFKKFRLYHNLFLKYSKDKWTVVPMLDVAWQEESLGYAKDYWMWAPALSIRYAFSDKWGVATRWDHVYDPNNIIPELNARLTIPSQVNSVNNSNGWQSHSLTITLERMLNENLKCRLESRYGLSKDKVFLDGINNLVDFDGFVLMSIAANF